MRIVLTTLLLTILLTGILLFGIDYRQLRHDNRDLRNQIMKLEAIIGQAGQSYSWLSEPVLEAGEKKYSRAQLLDLLLAKALTGANK